MITRLSATILTASVVLLGLTAVTSASSAVEPVDVPAAPEKAEVVFESGGRILSVKADGSDRSVLTRENVPLDDVYGDGDDSPSVSPDGTSLLFTRYLEEDPSGPISRIMIADRDGSSPRALLPNEANPGTAASQLYAPVWSRDSNRVFFIRFAQASRNFVSEIRSIRADGSGMRLIKRSTTRFDKDDVTLTGAIPLAVAPSPEGDKLLVSYFSMSTEQSADLYLMNPVNGKLRLLEKDAFSGTWSPDGSRIAFASERDHLNKNCYEDGCSFDAQLFVMKADGSGVRRIVPGKIRGSAYAPAWSANGGRIAFTSDRTVLRNADSAEIFSIRPDGKCLTRLTNGSPPGRTPSWGPEKGRSAAPGTCGDAAPRVVAEILPGPDLLGLEQSPFWLGPSFGNSLLTELYKDGRAVTMEYGDCGALNSRKCSRPVSVTSGPVCERLSGSVFDDGTFKRLVKRRGALVMLTGPSGGGLETIAYSGGIETGIYTRRWFRGRKITSADHLRLVDQMRPVTSMDPETGFEPAVFALDEVQQARVVLRSWRRLGTLAEAAEKQGMFPKLAAAYLRFGKGLERRGKVLTVKCHRRTAVPGSLKPR